MWRRMILLIVGVAILLGIGLISERWDNLSVRYGDFAYAGEGNEASIESPAPERDPAGEGGD